MYFLIREDGLYMKYSSGRREAVVAVNLVWVWKKIEVEAKEEEEASEQEVEEEISRRLLEPMYERFIGVQICILNMRRLAPEWVEDVGCLKRIFRTTLGAAIIPFAIFSLHFAYFRPSSHFPNKIKKKREKKRNHPGTRL